jgi:hypothetical protein
MHIVLDMSETIACFNIERTLYLSIHFILEMHVALLFPIRIYALYLILKRWINKSVHKQIKIYMRNY